MLKLIEYLKKLTLGGSKESSKRFIALYIGVILITYVVLRFTDSTNNEIILGELIAFVLTLLGIASYETIKGVNNEQR
jgi:hypothetical protein